MLIALTGNFVAQEFGYVAVPAAASAERSRLAVASSDGELVGLVLVRDAVRATTFGRPVAAKVTEAVAAMRADRAQLALVREGERTVGFVALEDLLEEVIGEFDDETDAVPQGRRMR